MAKGANFEREICKQLSLWWTSGSRDDIFWRSSQSGGRATIRGRQGKRTAGSYGDIVALDPIGETLLKHFTIELKRGRSHGEPGDLLDCKGSPKCHAWIKTLEQAMAAYELADSYSWLIICRRDFRNASVFFPVWNINNSEGSLYRHRVDLCRPLSIRYRLPQADFLGVTLEKFLSCVDPGTLGAP